MSNEWKDWLEDKKIENREWIKKYPFLEIVQGHDETIWRDFVETGWQETVFDAALDELLECYEEYPFLILDVKEKFGELRIYISYDEKPYNIENIDDRLQNLLIYIAEKSRGFCPICGRRKAPKDNLCKICSYNTGRIEL